MTFAWIREAQSRLTGGLTARWNGGSARLEVIDDDDVVVAHLDPQETKGDLAVVRAWALGVDAGYRFVKPDVQHMVDRRDRDMPGVAAALSEGLRIGDTIRIKGVFPEAKDASLEPTPRPVLLQFAAAMETKLRKNDHKTSWRTLPVEALRRLLQIEMEEFKVAMEFLSVAEARNELTDIANFALILWDRLGLEDQKAKVQT